MTRDRSQGSAVDADTPSPGPAEAARAWRESLPPERRRRSDLRGGLFFAAGASAYLLTFVGAFRLPTWWLQTACLLANPLGIGALFVVAHDACHGSLVRSGWLNRLLGRLSLLPAWHPVASWVHVHHTLHHRWTNFKGRDTFSPFAKAEFDRLPLWRQSLERFYRSPLGVGVCYATDLYVQHLLFPRGISARPGAAPSSSTACRWPASWRCKSRPPRCSWAGRPTRSCRPRRTPRRRSCCRGYCGSGSWDL